MSDELDSIALAERPATYPPNPRQADRRLRQDVAELAVNLQRIQGRARDLLDGIRDRADALETWRANLQAWRTGTVNPALQSHETRLDDLEARVAALEQAP